MRVAPGRLARGVLLFLHIHQDSCFATGVVILPAALRWTIGLHLCPTVTVLTVALEPPAGLLSGYPCRVALLTGARAGKALWAVCVLHTDPSLPLERMTAPTD